MGGPQSNKKQREVYVGNLTIGAVTDVMLRELFNGALSHLMPNAELNPPVVNVGMDPSGACLPPPLLLLTIRVNGPAVLLLFPVVQAAGCASAYAPHADRFGFL